MDITDLIAFYQTPLGAVLEEGMASLVTSLCPDFFKKSQGVHVLLGYPLGCFSADGVSACLLPSDMGGISWPNPHHNKTVLCEMDLLPLCDQSIDHLLVIHSFEYMKSPKIFLAECYRVLKRDGHLTLITPNRRSLWAHSDCTPLGFGQPYTMTQLVNQVHNSLFTVEKKMRGLFTPPYNNDLTLSCCHFFEHMGALCMSKFSGLVGIDAIKAAPLGTAFVKNRVRVHQKNFVST